MDLFHPPETHSHPFVSIVIPVRNSPKRIANCIEHLLQQTYPKDRFEIIVVDNGSTDETADVIQEFPVKYLIETRAQSPYTARNKGIKAAIGDIIALIDANCFATPHWIQCGVEIMQQENADLVGGKISFLFSGKKKTAAEIFDSVSNVKMRESITKRQVAKGGNLFIRRKVFDSIGLFPGNIRSGLDVLWTRRATRSGFKLSFSEKAEVSYPARRLVPLLKKSYRVGQGQPRIWREEGLTGINLWRRISAGFDPVRPSILKRGIKKRGTEDMLNQIWKIWFVAWLCAIASNSGRLHYLSTRTINKIGKRMRRFCSAEIPPPLSLKSTFHPRTLNESFSRCRTTQKLVVIGLSHSGTSLLQRLLNAYPTFQTEYDFFGDKVIYNTSSFFRNGLRSAVQKNRADKFIFLIRDPRARILSYWKWIQQRDKIYSHTVASQDNDQFAAAIPYDMLVAQGKLWNIFARDTLELSQDSSKCTWIRYEDLVTNPHDTIKRLLLFLDLNQSLYPFSVLSKVNAASVDKWKSELDDATKKLTYDFTNSYLNNFRYQ
ncbi:MAG: glycosyltransferase [Desulfobulbaceae bacterium]|nr:glycosyltransferase [Desulfobulbaceae bacterium]